MTIEWIGGPEPQRYYSWKELPEPWRTMMGRLEEFSDHPIRCLFEKLGNGIFEDDCSLRPFPNRPWVYYRFRRNKETAYIWERDGQWFVSPWHSMRKSKGRSIQEVASLRAALDRLALQKQRPWWKFWQ